MVPARGRRARAHLPSPCARMACINRLALRGLASSTTEGLPFEDHPVKLERQREGCHGPCARLTCTRRVASNKLDHLGSTLRGSSVEVGSRGRLPWPLREGDVAPQLSEILLRAERRGSGAARPRAASHWQRRGGGCTSLLGGRCAELLLAHGVSPGPPWYPQRPRPPTACAAAAATAAQLAGQLTVAVPCGCRSQLRKFDAAAAAIGTSTMSGAMSDV